MATATFDNVTTPNWPFPIPSVPQGLTATAGHLHVDLSWSASTGALNYNIKRAILSGGPYTNIANVTATNYTDSDVLANYTYYYMISALNAGGESDNSTSTFIKVIAPPDLNISQSDTNLVFTWPSSMVIFKLQWRTNLTLGDWQTITSPTARSISNHWQLVIPFPDDSPAMYYRLIK